MLIYVFFLRSLGRKFTLHTKVRMIPVRIIEVRMRVIKTSENKLLEVAFISLIRSGSVEPVTRVRTEDLIENIGVNPSANLL